MYIHTNEYLPNHDALSNIHKFEEINKHRKYFTVPRNPLSSIAFSVANFRPPEKTVVRPD